MKLYERISTADARVSRTLDLGDYHEGYRGAIFQVWVNPTRAIIKDNENSAKQLQEARRALAARRQEALKLQDEAERGLAVVEIAADELAAANEWRERLLCWLDNLWLNVPLDEVRQIRDHLEENDPVAWDWLIGRTAQLVGTHRRDTLKN